MAEYDFNIIDKYKNVLHDTKKIAHALQNLSREVDCLDNKANMLITYGKELKKESTRIARYIFRLSIACENLGKDITKFIK